MGIVSWIILGLIAGFIASKILNRTGAGLILDLVLGMVGAAVGGFIFSGVFGMSGHRRQHLEHHRLGDWRDHRAVDLRGAGRENLTRRRVGQRREIAEHRARALSASRPILRAETGPTASSPCDAKPGFRCKSPYTLGERLAVL